MDVTEVNSDAAVALVGETNGCLLVEVAPEKVVAFEKYFDDLPCRNIGQVAGNDKFTVQHHAETKLEISISECVSAFTGNKHV